MPPKALARALNAKITDDRLPRSDFLYVMPRKTLIHGINPASKNPMSNRQAYSPCQSFIKPVQRQTIPHAKQQHVRRYLGPIILSKTATGVSNGTYVAYNNVTAVPY